MEFTEQTPGPFGEVLLSMAIPTDLSLKSALVLRMTKELVRTGCLPPEGSPQAEVVLDEALTNAMLHGNRLDRSKKVQVELFADAERWGVTVRDEGEGFGPQDVPDPADLETILSESGRGIMLMDAYAERLVYGAGGRCLWLVRRRETASAGAEARAAAPESAPPPSPAEGPLRVRREGDVCVAEVLEERISDENVEELRVPLMQHAEQAEALVLDMHRVRFISSRPIGLLVAVYKHLRARNRSFVIAAPQQSVRDILASVHLDRLFSFAADVQEALGLARGGRGRPEG